jgi:hypothetical protein
MQPLWPIVGGPATVRQGMAPPRELCCRAEGFAHVSRSGTGLSLSPPKTLQGIYAGQGWEPGAGRSRRARQAAVVETGGDAEALRPHHRAVIAGAHRGCGREGSSVDGTSAPHERGLNIWGVTQAGEHVAKRLGPSQTVVTAVLAPRARLDGLAGRGQLPQRDAEEMAYVHETGRARSTQMAAARGRMVEWWHHRVHRRG